MSSGGSALIRAGAQGMLDYWGQSLNESLGNVTMKLGTFWVRGSVGLDVGEGSPIAFIQSHTRFVATFVVVASIMACGIQLMVSRRNEALERLGRGLLNTLVVSGAGVVAITSAVGASDAFSVWLMDAAMEGQAQGFGTAILSTTQLPAGGLFIVLILGGAALVANIVQIGLLYMRSALLILVIAVFPIVAAASSTEVGRAWWRKLLGFLLAVILYKPVATIIYALGVRVLASAKDQPEMSDGVAAYILGALFLIVAALALPPLISFLMPVSAAVGGGGSGAGVGALVGGVGAVASGSINVRGSASSAGTPDSGGGELAGGATTAGTASSSAASSGAASGAAGAAGGVGAAAKVAGESVRMVRDRVASEIEETSGPSGAHS